MIKLSKKENLMAKKSQREPYAKPELVKHENLKEITFECSGWQCSVVVPAGP